MEGRNRDGCRKLEVGTLVSVWGMLSGVNNTPCTETQRADKIIVQDQHMNLNPGRVILLRQKMSTNVGHDNVLK